MSAPFRGPSGPRPPCGPSAAEINAEASRWLTEVELGSIPSSDPLLLEWLKVPRHYVAYRRLELAMERADKALAIFRVPPANDP